MDSKPSLFSGQAVLRFFRLDRPAVERRSLNLPVRIERRRGPRCENCGVGTMREIPEGEPDSGKLRCEAPGCGTVADLVAINARECVIRAS